MKLYPTAGFIRRSFVARSVYGRAARTIKPVGLLVGLIVWLTLGIRPLHAHGDGEIKISKEPIGPYKLTVWLNPPQPQPGKTMHLTVGVLAEDNSPVLDAAVTVQMTSAETGQIVITEPATTEHAANKLFYETDFLAPDEGAYQISIAMTRGDVTGQVAFPTEVQTTRNTNWLFIGLVGIGLVLVMSLFLAGRSVRLEIPDSSQ